MLRAATDVGGTFTDIVVYSSDGRGGAPSVRTAKVDTTPPHFETGVLQALRKLGVDARAMTTFAHGATVVINTLTERKGAPTALLATRGFRDVLEIARGNRPDLFNFNYIKPPPFVPRHLRREIDERIDHLGHVLREPDLTELEGLVADWRQAGVRAVAICFLHAYRNPEHEQRVAARLRELAPEFTVLASHEVSREWREYERTSTTVLSAYVAPRVHNYLSALESALTGDGFAGAAFLMQSSGGMTTFDGARRNPIAMVESGPASGMLAAAELGKLIGQANVLALDIGGTTAKCALIVDGQARVMTEYHIERTRERAGYPIQTAVVEIVEIGNGGGSIAHMDAARRIHVGPESAGAKPGPVAYGRGGTAPTMTDAHLLAGRLDPQTFLGGDVRVDLDAVARAYAPIADALKIDMRDAALGVLRIANANMVNALRQVSTNKGYDPRDFALMAFGGGGGLHAVELAEELGIPEVILPRHAAVFSAWGMLLTDQRRDLIATAPIALERERLATIRQQFADLIEQARAQYSRDGVSTDTLRFEWLGDLRYQGQEHSVKVSLGELLAGDDDMALDAIAQRFHATHERLYAFRLDRPIGVVNLHLVATMPLPKPELAPLDVQGRELSRARRPSRDVGFDKHGWKRAEIIDLRYWPIDTTQAGPCVLQGLDTAMVVPPGYTAQLDTFGNVRVRRKETKA